MKKIFIVIALIFIPAFAVHAADVSVTAPESVEKGGPFAVIVNIDTGGVSINSFDITISYPKSLVTFEGYNEYDSIKKMWLQSPIDKSGLIQLSGVIPGGADGLYDPDKKGLQPIQLVKLLFSPKESGTGSFTIIHSDILENNGLGSPLIHGNKSSDVTILPSALGSATVDANTNDIEPPVPFTIEYIIAGFFSKTPSMIVFSATDIDSGINKYQVKIGNGSWIDAKSPLAVSKGLIKKDVTVRAIDYSGNIREARVQVPGLISTTQFILLILGLVVCYLLLFMVKRKR